MDGLSDAERTEIDDFVDFSDAQDEFTDAMERRFRQKYAEGYRGWDSEQEEVEHLPNDLAWVSGEHNFVEGMLRSIEKRHWVDVANWAMFIWNLERKRQVK